MNNFLSRLATRAIDPKPGLRPVTAPLFAPANPMPQMPLEIDAWTDKEASLLRYNTHLTTGEKIEITPKIARVGKEHHPETQPELPRNDKSGIAPKVPRMTTQSHPLTQPETPQTRTPIRGTSRTLVSERPRTNATAPTAKSSQETLPEHVTSSILGQHEPAREMPAISESKRTHLRAAVSTSEPKLESESSRRLTSVEKSDSSERDRLTLSPRINEPLITKNVVPQNTSLPHTAGSAQPPIIEVTIGRIEVRASTTSAAPAPPRRNTPRPLPLDEYLRGNGRDEGKRR